MPRLMRFPTAVRREPAIDAWFEAREGALGALARGWFEVVRSYVDMKRRLDPPPSPSGP